MKNALKYLMLWQKKRSELPVNDNPQADWNEMRSLLDRHMPVTGNGGGGVPSKKFKLWPMLLVSLSAAAMTYFGAHIIEKRNQRHQQHNKSYKIKTGTGHYSDSLFAVDSLKTKDSTGDNQDSLTGLKQATTNNPGIATPGSDKAANTASGAVRAKDSTATGSSSVLANSAAKNRVAVNNQQNKNAGQNSLVNNQTRRNRPFLLHAGKNSTVSAGGKNPALFQSQGTGQTNTPNTPGHQYNARCNQQPNAARRVDIFNTRAAKT